MINKNEPRVQEELVANYAAKVFALGLIGQMINRPGTVNVIECTHDEDCSHYQDALCDCNPDIFHNGRLLDSEYITPDVIRFCANIPYRVIAKICQGGTVDIQER